MLRAFGASGVAGTCGAMRSRGALLGGMRDLSSGARAARRSSLGASRSCPRARARARPRRWTRARFDASPASAQASRRKVVESRPLGLTADETGQSLARLGERPDVSRLEAHARKSMSLRLSSISRQEVVEVRLIRQTRREVSIGSGAPLAKKSRPRRGRLIEQFGRLANCFKRAQALRQSFGKLRRRRDPSAAAGREEAGETSERRARRP